MDQVVRNQKHLVLDSRQAPTLWPPDDRSHNVSYIALHPLSALQEWPAGVRLLWCHQHASQQKLLENQPIPEQVQVAQTLVPKWKSV